MKVRELSNSPTAPKAGMREEALFLTVWDSVVCKMFLGVTDHGVKYMRVTAFQFSPTAHDVKDNVSCGAHNDINTFATLPHFHFIKGRTGLKLTVSLFIVIFLYLPSIHGKSC